MSKLLRLGLAFVAVAGSLIGLAPGTASAGSGASTVPFITSPLTVGQTGTFDMRLRNDNENAGEPFDFEAATNTVCNQVPQAGTNCSALIEGITFTPSCGVTGAFSVCSQPDPNVFQLGTTATVVSGACNNALIFDVSPLNDADGRYLFTPQGGQSVLLPGADAECRIRFSYTVVKLPTIDADSTIAGVQTIAIADHTQSVNGTTNTASGRGQSFPMTINRATPFLNTTASAGVVVGGGTLTDTAVMSGRQFPTAGTVSFRLYGPDDATCSGTPVFTDLNVVYPASPANGSQLTSAPFTPTAAGTYRWVATYNGDTNNASVAGTCGDPTETRVVAKASPTITTTASANQKLGAGTLSDTATVAGRVNPVAGGTVVFNLYGPNDATCANAPVFTSSRPLPVADGPVTSAAFTPSVPGTYQWVASYSGDANNNAVAGSCTDAAERTAVAKATPTITTDASDRIAIGGAITDTATVAGRVSPLASTIDFSLYGPNNSDCSGTPVFTSFGVAYGAATTSATSAAFTPTLPGVYRWVATYNGDANNEAVTGTCGDPAETVQVFGGLSRIVTNASPGTFVGDGKALTDVATVLDRVDPDNTGIVDFRLYGPNDATCAGTPIFQTLGVAYPATGGSVTSGSFVPTVPGVYRWVASYRGDGNNSTAQGTCGDPAETITVAPTPSVVVELPATGPGAVASTLILGVTSLAAGVALLGLSNRRRRPSAI